MFNIKNLLCRLGLHNWSANRGGVRICMRCPAVDRHYGISGYLRRKFDIMTTHRRGASDAELREEWLKQAQQKEDLKYMIMAEKAALDSTCAKKQLGCVLVLKNTDLNIKGTYSIKGTNGPPQGLKKCDPGPRMDSHNGSDTQKCRAVHAERQVILKAAHLGLPTCGSTLYSYMGVPCKDCLLELWEAGVEEIVVINENYYDELSREILKEWIDCGRKFRVVNSANGG
jgi:deoxycytidylate deaminase